MLHVTKPNTSVMNMVTKEAWVEVTNLVEEQCSLITMSLIVELGEHFPI